MNKSFLTRIALGLSLAVVTGQVQAQVAPFPQTANAVDYVGARFSVTAPTNIAGSKAIELTNDGNTANTNNWGLAVTTPYINIPVVHAYGPSGTDSFGTGTLINGTGTYPSMAGKFALIFRGGNISFTRKAKLCEALGATGVIIVNNIPGGPVGMANTATEGTIGIPVLMVSDVDGIAMNTQLRNGQTVTISLATWGFGFTHDIGILPEGVVLGHSFAIPAAQLASDNGNPSAYKLHTGAFVGTFGTAATETNIKLVNKVTFNPTSGAPVVLHADSLSVASLAATDSLVLPASTSEFDIHATANGRIDQTYTLTMNDTDANIGDNMVTKSFYVTDSVFCKSRFDNVAGKPIGNISNRFQNSSPYVWGPLFYVAKGGYAIRAVQLAVNKEDQPELNGEPELNVNVFKWVDANADGLLTSAEVTLVGVATKTFVLGDSSFRFFTAPVVNPNGGTGSVIAEANTWYWIAPDMPGDMYLVSDGVSNYYPRSYVRKVQSGVRESYAPIFSGIGSDILGGSDAVEMYPFQTGSVIDSTASYPIQAGLVPSIAMHLSKNLAPSAIGKVAAQIGTIDAFPNPATNGSINVSLKLKSVSEKVSISILDAVGHTVKTEQYRQVKDGNYTISTVNLASGNYYVIARTDNGVVSKKVLIANK